MSILVTCGSDIVLSYSAVGQTAVLSATSVGGATSYTWTILSVPPGSTALSETRGDFVNGVATVQNPSFVTDASIAGTYCIQCVATGTGGTSEPVTDREDGQQNVVVRTQLQSLTLPSDYQWAWGNYNNNNFLALELLVGLATKIRETAGPTDLTVGSISDGQLLVRSGSTVVGTLFTHASRHQSGGTDAIKLDDLSTPDDNTDLNASTARHGLLPKLDNTATNFLNGTGTWSAPTGTSHASSHQNSGSDEISVTGLSGLLADGQTPLAHATSHRSGGADSIRLDELAAPTDVVTLDASITAHGLLPKLNNNAGTFLNGVGAWSAPAGAGDVVGPAGATDHAIVRFDLATGKILQNSLLTISDTGELDMGTAAITNVGNVDGVDVSDHSARHESGGADAIKLDDLSAPDDNTDLNASITAHGLLRKLDNTVTHFLDGQGGWTVPSGYLPLSTKGDIYAYSTDNTRLPVGTDGQLLSAKASESTGLDWISSTDIKLDDLGTPDDNTDLDASTARHGLLPKLDNNSANFLNGQGAWAVPPGGASSPLTTTGDIWVFGAADTRLPIGTEGQVLTVLGESETDLTWADATDDDAIHISNTGEINTLDSKGTPVDADILLIEDSAAGWAKKKIAFSTLGATDSNAIHDNVASEISAITEKTIPSLDDMVLIEDSADSNNKKMVKLSSIPPAAGTSGTIIYEDDVADVTLPASGIPVTPITSVDITTIEGEDIEVIFVSYSQVSVGDFDTGYFLYVYVDNVLQSKSVYTKPNVDTAGWRFNSCFTRYILGLSAGTHTVEVRGRIGSATGQDVIMESPLMQVVLHRGGLIPAYNDGELVLAATSGLNFIGDHFDIVNSGNILNIIDIPVTQVKGDIYTYSDSGVRLPVGTDGQLLSSKSSESTGLDWIPSTDIKLDDLGTPDDNTDLNSTSARHGLLPKLDNVVTDFLNGQGGWTIPSGYLPLTTKGDIYTYDTNNTRLPLEVTSGLVLTISPPTQHGFHWEVRNPMTRKGDLSTRNETIEDVLHSGYNSQLLTCDNTETVGLKWAYYMPDTRLPVLSAGSSGKMRVMNPPGITGERGSGTRVTFPDGIQRTPEDDILRVGTTVGLEGLDTGVIANNTWYYMYLVPYTSNDEWFSAVCSVTGPETGPTGYSNWVYVGASRYGTGDWVPVQQINRDTFLYAERVLGLWASATTHEAAMAEVDCSAYAPVTAGSIRFWIYAQTDNGTSETSLWFIRLYTSATATNIVDQLVVGDHSAGAGENFTTQGNFEVPFFDNVIKIWRQAYRSSGAANLDACSASVIGWVDQYL